MTPSNQHQEDVATIPTERFRAALANLQAATETLLRYPDLEPVVAQQFYEIILDEIHRLTEWIPQETENEA